MLRELNDILHGRSIVKPAQPTGRKLTRGFKGAYFNRFVDWAFATLTKINLDINTNLLDVVRKCRDLAKNNALIRAYLGSCVKNVIGTGGITLQVQTKSKDGTLNEEFNNEVEWLFYEWGKDGNLTTDGGMTHRDLDSLILRTLLIDGEAFIRIRKDKSKFGIRFQVVDSASIDYTKIRESSESTNAIVLGIEVDAYYKPVKYYIKKGNSTIYEAGKLEEVPAADIIHIYIKEFPEQVRGIPRFNAILNDMKQIEDYKEAEIMAAKMGACLGVFYERNQAAVNGEFMAEGGAEVNEDGEFVQSIAPRNGVSRANRLQCKACHTNTSKQWIWRIQQGCIEADCIFIRRQLC